MPIRIISKSFTDEFGFTTSFYQCNAGDKVTAEIEIESSIYFSSQSNPMFYDYTLQEITLSSGSWVNEGFRVGDFLQVNRYSAFGVLMGAGNCVVEYVDDQIMKVTPVFTGWAITANQEYMVLEVLNHNRQSVEFALNLVKNGQTGNDFSLIDAEATRFNFENVDSMLVGGTQSGVIIGNQSGQARGNREIERLANVGNAYRFKLTFDFDNTGWYDSDWFASSDCLKMYLKSAWSTINGEPFDKTIVLINDDANTGWFNQAYNSNPTNSTLIQGVDAIDYSVPTTFEVVVDGPLATLGIGACYVSQDSTYYKNRTERQQNISILKETQSTTITPQISFNGVVNTENYTIDVNSVVSVGLTHTINLTFTPNPAFTTFMDAREEGDRLFYFWVKSGFINHLAFADQLTKQPPVGGALDFEEKVEFFDHSQNVVDNSDAFTDITDLYDTEDDLAFWGAFLLDNDAVYETLSCRVEAFNTVTEDTFTLQQHTFSFGAIQISNSGQYLVDQSLSVNPLLPNTSLKRNALFKRYDSIDVGSQYGVSIYYPIVLRWEYWLEQLNANVDFYPTQNKNWQQYSDLGDWIVRLTVELVQDGLAYVYSKEIDIFDYNNEAGIDSEIEMIRDLDNTVIEIIPEGELMRIKATHTLTAGMWNSATTWAQIRCYPTEGAPPWISSSVLNYDNNTLNPLTPITGTTASLTFPALDTAVVECYFDSNLLNLSNGATFTAKIKDKDDLAPLGGKTTSPDDVQKTTSSNSISQILPKTLA
jgi:hypothetical protein